MSCHDDLSQHDYKDDTNLSICIKCGIIKAPCNTITVYPKKWIWIENGLMHVVYKEPTCRPINFFAQPAVPLIKSNNEKKPNRINTPIEPRVPLTESNNWRKPYSSFKPIKKDKSLPKPPTIDPNRFKNYIIESSQKDIDCDIFDSLECINEPLPRITKPNKYEKTVVKGNDENEKNKDKSECHKPIPEKPRHEKDLDQLINTYGIICDILTQKFDTIMTIPYIDMGSKFKLLQQVNRTHNDIKKIIAEINMVIIEYK